MRQLLIPLFLLLTASLHLSPVDCCAVVAQEERRRQQQHRRHQEPRSAARIPGRSSSHVITETKGVRCSMLASKTAAKTAPEMKSAEINHDLR